MTHDHTSDNDDGQDVGEGGTRPSEHFPFGVSGEAFVQTIEALREVHEEVAPRLRELDTTRLDPTQLAAVRGLSAEKQAELAAWLRSIEGREPRHRAPPALGAGSDQDPSTANQAESAQGQESGHSDGAGVPELPDAPSEPSQPRGEGDDNAVGPGPPVGGEPPAKGEGMTAADSAALESIFEGSLPKARLAMLHLSRKALSPGRKQIVNGALLTAAVGAFEVLAGRIYAQFLLRFPDALGSEKEFSLADLERFDSLEDAREDAVARRVDQFVRTNLPEWAGWFSEAAKQDMKAFAHDFDVVQEIILRRNLIVHNGGRVNRRYLAALPASAEPHELGHVLAVSDAYLEEALDAMEILGTIWLAAAWGKWADKEYSVAWFVVYERTYASLLARRWEVAKCLARAGLRAKLDEGTLLTFKANHWLARKRIHGVDSIRKEVDDWDTSASGLRFRLAKAALIDDLETACELARAAHSAGELTVVEMQEWPLLDELRMSGCLADLLGAA